MAALSFADHPWCFHRPVAALAALRSTLTALRPTLAALSSVLTAFRRTLAAAAAPPWRRSADRLAEGRASEKREVRREK
jgi:hypothetical protein